MDQNIINQIEEFFPRISNRKMSKMTELFLNFLEIYSITKKIQRPINFVITFPARKICDEKIIDYERKKDQFN